MSSTYSSFINSPAFMPLTIAAILIFVIGLIVLISPTRTQAKLNIAYTDDRTGEEVLTAYGIKNGIIMPATTSKIQFDNSVDVLVTLGNNKFIAVFDIDVKDSTHIISDNVGIKIFFKKDFLQNKIGVIDQHHTEGKVFIETVILNPNNIASMTLYTTTALT